jgi:hypothetical protein
MHNEHLMPTRFLLAAWGAPIDLVSPAFGADDLLACFFLAHFIKSDSLFLVMPLGERVFFVVFLIPNGESLVWVLSGRRKN